jgi:hypothetical protein
MLRVAPLGRRTAGPREASFAGEAQRRRLHAAEIVSRRREIFRDPEVGPLGMTAPNGAFDLRPADATFRLLTIFMYCSQIPRLTRHGSLGHRRCAGSAAV